ncbi:HAMP domain-containing sensor histidine kinase [Nocardioides sp. SR21]|uniref:sensor histidine kinase n=1 Tax=Nocardioides sp. SR21 TaxID=2919501 RepID=UPI001FAAA1F8|nr:HAMP domain-containing sensor histidine kinase [Nocardioides sp. SR21]
MGTGGERTRWDGAWSAGALALTCTPLLALPLVYYETIDLEELAKASNVVSHVFIVFAVLLLYLHWRLTNRSSGWKVLVLTALSVQGLALATFTLDPDRMPSADLPWILLMQLVLAAAVLATVGLSARFTLRADPLVVGVVIGLTIGGIRRTLLSLHDSPTPTDFWMVVFGIALLATDLVISVAIIRLSITPLWMRWRLAAALVLLSFAHAATYSVQGSVLLNVVMILGWVLGATLLLSFAGVLARTSWLDNQEALEVLARQLQAVEADARADQAKLHEIRATVAGLGSASRLVHHGSAVGEVRRRQLEEMIGSEMARLQRLLHERPQERCAIDLDATISPIVLRHRTRGYPVDWMPSGDQAIARADDVAEVINVLLENAYQHAPHGSASIVTRRTAGVVEIAVSDTGPGIDRSLRSRIFEWGQRGGASHGSGIGLNVAQQLTASLGGYLRLVDSPLPGTTFVLGLPTEELS